VEQLALYDIHLVILKDKSNSKHLELYFVWVLKLDKVDSCSILFV
jgi:hypothetical protein